MSEKLTAALYKLDLLVSKQDRGVSRYENSTQTHTHTHTHTQTLHVVMVRIRMAMRI